MFKIMEDSDGRLVVITDNPRISDLIREETLLDPQRVFFTGAPNERAAISLAWGLLQTFGKPALAVQIKQPFSSDFSPWAAQFIGPV